MKKLDFRDGKAFIQNGIMQSNVTNEIKGFENKFKKRSNDEGVFDITEFEDKIHSGIIYKKGERTLYKFGERVIPLNLPIYANKKNVRGYDLGDLKLNVFLPSLYFLKTSLRGGNVFISNSLNGTKPFPFHNIYNGMESGVSIIDEIDKNNILSTHSFERVCVGNATHDIKFDGNPDGFYYTLLNAPSNFDLGSNIMIRKRKLKPILLKHANNQDVIDFSKLCDQFEFEGSITIEEFINKLDQSDNLTDFIQLILNDLNLHQFSRFDKDEFINSFTQYENINLLLAALLTTLNNRELMIELYS